MGRKRRIAAFLAIFAAAAGMMRPAVFAEEGDTYTYVYNDNGDWSISPHAVHVTYAAETGEDADDGSAEEPSGEEQDIVPHMFRLDQTGEAEPDADTDAAAYCCDIKTTIQAEQQYRRINLEDATYFDDETAERLRGVLTSGYWHDWEDGDVAAVEAGVNQWIAGQGEADCISGLTRAEAMTATQAAIWYIAEGLGSDEEITGFLPYGTTTFHTSWAEDGAVLDDRVDVSEQAGENTKRNIELFYEYLLQQTAKAADTVLFTDEHFLSEQSASQKDGRVTLRFRLTGTAGAEDDLKLTAAIGDRDPLEYPLTGDGRITPDGDGYYTLTFDDVTEEELQSAIRLSVKGNQMMNGVCFYEAKPADGSSARATSQNLIGKVSALTAVYAEAVLELAGIPEEEPGGSETGDEPEEDVTGGIEDGKTTENQESTVITEAAGGAGKAAALQTGAVQTGDDSNMTPWIAACCAAAAAMMIIGGAKRGKEK